MKTYEDAIKFDGVQFTDPETFLNFLNAVDEIPDNMVVVNVAFNVTTGDDTDDDDDDDDNVDVTTEMNNSDNFVTDEITFAPYALPIESGQEILSVNVVVSPMDFTTDYFAFLVQAIFKNLKEHDLFPTNPVFRFGVNINGEDINEDDDWDSALPVTEARKLKYVLLHEEMRAYPDTYQNIKAMFIINPDSTDYDDFDFFDDDNYDDDDDEEVQEALEQMLDSVNSAEELSKMLDNFGLDEYSKQQIIEEFEKTYEDDDVKGLPSNKKE